MCFVSYRVDYRKTGVGPWIPVDPAHPTYDDIVINGNLATWDVSRLPKDTYDLRLRGVDECGNVGIRAFKVDVDNSGDCGGCNADLNGNAMVDFDDLLQMLSDWGPCPH